MEKVMRKLKDLDPGEREKLRQYLQESKDGKEQKEELSWMYKGDRPDNEEYLLGRKIDRHIGEDHAETEEKKDLPGASFEEVIKRRADIDMHAKMREDPLYQIQRQQEESRKRLLQNPVKMKQLQKMLEEKQAKKKKTNKKKKKHKKKDSSSESSEDSDDELLEQYLAIVKSKKGGKTSPERRSRDFPERSKHSNRSKSSHWRDLRDRDHRSQYYASKSKHELSPNRKSPVRTKTGSKYSPERSKTKTKYSERSKISRTTSEDSNSSDSDSPSKHRSKHKTDSRPRKSTKHKQRHKSASSDSDSENDFSKSKSSKQYYSSNKVSKDSKSRSRDYSDEESQEQRKSYGLIGGMSKRRERSRSPHRKRSRSRSPVVRDKPKKREPSPPRKKLSKEEMDRKRREMMEAAKWRDEQREKNVKTYKEQDEREESMLKKQQGKGRSADFITPIMSSHAEQSTVEDRLKRNVFNIQRTSAALDKKFTEK